MIKYIVILLFLNTYSQLNANDKIFNPIKNLSNITKKVTDVFPLKILKEVGKKITGIGTNKLMLGMATATLLSEGLTEDSKENRKIIDTNNLIKVTAKGQISLNNLNESEAQRRALEDALYFASMQAGVKVQGFSSIDEKTTLNENFIVKPNNQILDYSQEVGAYGGIILALESELAKQKIELATMKRIFIDPNAPEIKVLEDQIIALKNQINEERKDLVSISGKNLTETALTLDRLKSNVGFRKDVYQSSLGTAEAARLESFQQQRFLAILMDPIYPEIEWRSWRHKGFLTLLSILIVGYALTKFIIGMTDSHL